MLALSFAFYTNEAGLRKRNRDSKHGMSTLINLDPSAYASDSQAVMRIRTLGSRLHLDGMYAGCSMRMRILLCWRLRLSACVGRVKNFFWACVCVTRVIITLSKTVAIVTRNTRIL